MSIVNIELYRENKLKRGYVVLGDLIGLTSSGRWHSVKWCATQNSKIRVLPKAYNSSVG